MKFLHLVWAGIWRRKGRAILTLLSILNAFLLFGLLQGFTSGLNNVVGEAHGDILYVTNRVSILEGLPLGHMAQIKSVPGVKGVTPLVVFTSTYRDPKNTVQAMGIDPASFFETYPSLSSAAPQLQAMRQLRTGALVGTTLQRLHGWKIGDTIPLRSLYWPNRDGSQTWPVTIVGTYTSKDPNFGANDLLINYDYVDQGRLSQNGTANLFIVRVADPNTAGDVSQAIDKLFANSPHETKTATEGQYVQDQIKQIGDIGFVVRAIMGAVFFALLLSVGTVMMQSVRERTPELAVLKTLGFSDGAVLGIVLSETVI
ncbi:MAG TPA: ABC transporter permease, partial [Caulobacteraceae bacterium]|nr:ABC transporter permease [Caulobacteraceae bacterium]